MNLEKNLGGILLLGNLVRNMVEQWVQYKMEDMMTFTAVDKFKVKIDPRMPSMGNHSSPNNTDLVQSVSGDLYNGKLSLTMTGYWKINIQLLNASGEVLKGEVVTPENASSSLFFELEF